MKRLSQLDPATQEEVALYVGKNFQEVYFPRWMKMEQKNTKNSWNWASFLFTTLWIAYRRMYSLAYSVVGLIIVLDLLAVFLLSGSFLASVAVDFTIALTFGILGNHYYLEHAIKKVEQLQREIPNPEQRISHIKSISGGSASAVWVLIFVAVTYGVVAGIFLYPTPL